MKFYLALQAFQVGWADNVWWFDILGITTNHGRRCLFSIFSGEAGIEVEFLFVEIK